MQFLLCSYEQCIERANVQFLRLSQPGVPRKHFLGHQIPANGFAEFCHSSTGPERHFFGRRKRENQSFHDGVIGMGLSSLAATYGTMLHNLIPMIPPVAWHYWRNIASQRPRSNAQGCAGKPSQIEVAKPQILRVTFWKIGLCRKFMVSTQVTELCRSLGAGWRWIKATSN